MPYIPVSDLSEEQYIIRRDKWRIAQQKTRDAVNERNRKSRIKLKEKIAEKRNTEEAKSKKALCDKLYREKIKKKFLLRARMAQVLKSQSANKIGQTIELTGCSVQELKIHLESQFQEGMSWSNYGKQKDNRLDSWEIDHIIPISTFDLTDEDQQRKCWHYTNLQPLWAIDNLQKKADPNWQKS